MDWRWCPRLRSMVGLLSFRLPLRKGVWEIYQQQTWECHHGSCAQEGSIIVSESPRNHILTNKHTLPFRSRKNTAEAILYSYGGVITGWCERCCLRESKRPAQLLLFHQIISAIQKQRSTGDGNINDFQALLIPSISNDAVVSRYMTLNTRLP